jgi:hypothetical protein
MLKEERLKEFYEILSYAGLWMTCSSAPHVHGYVKVETFLKADLV